MVRASYPKNPYVRNGKVVDYYLLCLRRGWRIPAKVIGLVLGCEIGCDVPERLFIPHPNGVVVDTYCQLSNDVVLLQQVTLGVAQPYWDHRVPEREVDPIIEEGVYVGPGAKVLGRVTIGKWSVIGANAVVTTDVPAGSIVVGHNRILQKKASELRFVPEPGVAGMPV